ncbi:MAG: hypothetical protein L6Q98_06760 [Anaerolineae bacterium]|nr:hypothetical protein [Anaerolineae bacterium]NUQ02885.1 hypothetical protein [Anaerolineae bacterium]
MPEILEFTARALVFLLGVGIVFAVISAAVRTFVLPRSAFDPLTSLVFRAVYLIFRMRANTRKTYEELDSTMALFAPIALLILPVVWVVLIILGYTLMFWSAFSLALYDSFSLAGSSLLTLGFTKSEGVLSLVFEFSAAIFGLTMVALLIAYLPTMYSAFSQREVMVTLLETRAGSPPSAQEMILRAYRIGGLEAMDGVWHEWEQWFAEIDESHTSLIALVFFRSPDPHRSWVTAAGTVLDAAAILISAVSRETPPTARLMIRAGYVALRHVADYFAIDYNPAPQPSDPISISQDEFNDMLDQLATRGVPLKPDRDQAWRDFSGWRVNYDRPLLALAALTMAPYAPWVSDRSIPVAFRRTQRAGLLGRLGRTAPRKR